MKLVGSYTSPFIRKLSILLLGKGTTFEFTNELPYNTNNSVAQSSPLGKVSMLVTEEDERWFGSPIITEYIELMSVAPAMLPHSPLESLRVRKIEVLTGGIVDAGLVSVRGQARLTTRQSEDELLRRREKINRSLDVLEGYLVDGTLKTDAINLTTITIARTIGYLNPCCVTPDWCVDRPHLIKLVGNLFSCESLARTESPKA